MRCKGKIVDVGMSLPAVLALCGPPDWSWQGNGRARARNAQGFTYFSGLATTERFIYDRGYGRIPVQLVFIEGELRRIEHVSSLR